MATLIGVTVFFLNRIGPSLPATNAHLIVGIATTYVIAWLALLSLRVMPNRRAGDADLRWRRHDRAISAMGVSALIVGFWLAMPYADEAQRLLAVMFQFATVAVIVLGTIERPPARPSLPITMLALPVTTAIYFIVHWEPNSVAIVLFLAAYAWMALALSRVLQRSMDHAYAARQTAEAALVEAAAERDARIRFLASVSHDLGQPLQAARLFFDQTMRSPAGAQRDKAARRVEWAFDATEQLLRRLLDHLRLESGAVEPQIEDLGVGPLIARIAEMNEPAAKLAGLTLHALPSRLQVTADPALVEQALGNLVANSIRHAKGSRVLIGARRRDGRVRLWVIDDGVGVAEADGPRLFEDYVQGSDHGDEIRGGFGLGLASARRMAELMDGSVGLERKWLNGSAFWLELHLAKAVAR
jgi:signal transduction histidine kinase